MRTQDRNPAYRRFKHLLPPSGLYPARWVDIFSNTNDAMRYTDVEVVFVPRGADGPDLDRLFWDEFSHYNRYWLGDLGNSVAGWMEPDGLNPEKVFGGMLFYGFADQKALQEAVREFGHIEECDWARRMAAGQFPDVLRHGASDREAVESALSHQSKHSWARDMLDVFRREAAF